MCFLLYCVQTEVYGCLGWLVNMALAGQNLQNLMNMELSRFKGGRLVATIKYQRHNWTPWPVVLAGTVKKRADGSTLSDVNDRELASCQISTIAKPQPCWPGDERKSHLKVWEKHVTRLTMIHAWTTRWRSKNVKHIPLLLSLGHGAKCE